MNMNNINEISYGAGVMLDSRLSTYVKYACERVAESFSVLAYRKVSSDDGVRDIASMKPIDIGIYPPTKRGVYTQSNKTKEKARRGEPDLKAG